MIAGTARSLPLKPVRGMGTRPTTDRIKETLFNMISFGLEGSRFLDLFSTNYTTFCTERIIYKVFYQILCDIV